MPINATPRHPGAPRRVSGLADLAAAYDVILCDVWGVVHNGVAHHPAAVDALIRFRRGGGTVILITNAPNPQAKVRRYLDALEVPGESYDALVTSGDVTVALIVERSGVPLFHLGPPRELAVYRNVEAMSGHAPQLCGVDRAGFVVCNGLIDPLHEEPADYDGVLAAIYARKLDFICANPDLVVQVGDALMYCAGSIAERYEQLGGTVIQAGKPYPQIYTRALARAAAIRGAPVERARVLAIGDAMRTDIRGAHAQSIASLFVTSGIHAEELHGGTREGPLDAAALTQFLDAAGIVPTAVLPDLVWSRRPAEV